MDRSSRPKAWKFLEVCDSRVAVVVVRDEAVPVAADSTGAVVLAVLAPEVRAAAIVRHSTVRLQVRRPMAALGGCSEDRAVVP
jgi:hypothetical protein